MYQYTDFDKQFVKLRAAQHRDQLERWQAGKLAEAAQKFNQKRVLAPGEPVVAK